MTGLLVSVRNGDEARLALAGGADLIDVKEPAYGSLGAAQPAVWQAVLAVVAGRLPTSVALGELRQAPAPPDGQQLVGCDYAKVGLAGCRAWPTWPRRWAELFQQLPRSVTPVAVVYADWVAADAPAPAEVIEHAARSRCGAVLVDTYEKHRGDLFSHLTLAALSALVQGIRRHGLQVVLGGSLGPSSIRRALQAGPDYIAVRGAACEGPRTGVIVERCVRDLAALVKFPHRCVREISGAAPGQTLDLPGRALDLKVRTP